MGVTATLTVHAKDAPRLVQVGHELLRNYERLWSRFLPNSDITRLNNSNGATIEVHPETSQLVATMIAAHRETHGLFNPTLLPLQLSRGDNRSLVSDAVCTTSDAVYPWEDLDGITFHSPTSIALPKHMSLDAGGIAKGFAADQIALTLMHLGASSVSVNIGGDVRVMASDESTHDWNFDVCDTQGTHIWSTVSLHQGAIATSSMDARHRPGRGLTHHLFSIDNTHSEIALCSVIAGNATWAEAWTKLLFFSTDLYNDIQKRDLAAFIVDVRGNTFFSEKWKGYTL